MSTSRAIKPKRDDTHVPKWEAPPERAPSIERDDPPTIARISAMIGLFLVVLGGLSIFVRREGEPLIGPALGFFLASIGMCQILFHAFAERDLQIRRLYGFLGIALVVGGILLKLIALREGYEHWFASRGMPALFIGLIVLVAAVRNETDVAFRTILLNILAAVGFLAISFAIVNGMRNVNYLPGEGAALLIFGLLYVGAFISAQEITSEKGYYAGLALGAIGLLGVVIGIVRPILQPDSGFLIPSGLILIGMSVVYILVYVGTCVDWQVVVLTRRELAAYFYSPVGHLVFVGQLIYGWLMFLFFFARLKQQGFMFEPIIAEYIFNIFPVIVQMFIVPALTMRLLSEEKRSGTLEVLLTAPINELSVVLGKFFACWIFYILLWIPWWLFLVSLRYMGGEEFDFRPAISFMIAMGAISAGFLAMGLFFSSLTSNQIVAAVLSFAGMMGHLGLYFFKSPQFVRQGSALWEVLSSLSFLDFWMNSLDGNLAPRLVVLHLAIAVFFLFLTVKVLESRKWR